MGCEEIRDGLELRKRRWEDREKGDDGFLVDGKYESTISHVLKGDMRSWKTEHTGRLPTPSQS